MKKTLLLIPAAAFAIASCGSKTELTINGTTNGETENIYVVAGSADTLAVAPVVDGKFNVTVSAEEPCFLYIREDNGQLGAVIAEPGKVTYTMTEGTFKAVGTPLNDKYAQYRETSRDLFKEYQSAEVEDRDAIEEKMNKLDEDFLEDNLSNWLGVFMLTQLQYNMTGEELSEALAKLDPAFAENDDVIRLTDRAAVLMKTGIGKSFIEITQPSVDGTEISLSEVVAANKYVLLDFWASWCGPCMGEVPYLVKDYAEYHKKGFEIFGVSLDRTKEPWVKAIEEKQMSWIHVSDLKYWSSAPAADYGVNSIPANYLIDNNGIIVARNLRGEALGAKLAELLGQ